ncbi:MAG: MoaD/ThiS family protein [Kofleriaceae bacterium]|nr:MoaD/ThiS family protein [Myxococcales bacterium]MCB9565210.1 MoaD/ThiS family protein [Kofleriaceae bacterium]MCB9573347.1 MoaD/ThiS family protein [Kofleriaceae bacterium]
MGLFDRLRGDRGPRVQVQVLIRGRIGDGWFDLDETVKLAPGTTLGQLLDRPDHVGQALREAVTHSPHLAHTLMLNGDRCPVAEHADRVLVDGDQLYLLAPLAGG